LISDDVVVKHYGRVDLRSAIETGLVTAGLSLEALTPADLALVDEFHVGGRPATEHLLGQLGLSSGMEVLDVGCGIGGAARFCAHTHDTKVTGIDLTPVYVEVAQRLTDRVGLSSKVRFRVASAAELPFKKRTFDAAYLLHVGMNVPDKTGLFASVGRVLKRGARFGIYDLMRIAPGDLTFPVPWASSVGNSFLASPASYESSLAAAGFQVVHHEDRTGAVLETMQRLAREAADANGPPPPLGLHLLMGPDAPTKLMNLVAGLDTGLIAPVELVAVKTG
jgi:SAM-dependent methyltransferase